MINRILTADKCLTDWLNQIFINYECTFDYYNSTDRCYSFKVLISNALFNFEVEIDEENNAIWFEGKTEKSFANWIWYHQFILEHYKVYINEQKE